MEKILGLRRRDLLAEARELQVDVETIKAYVQSKEPTFVYIREEKKDEDDKEAEGKEADGNEGERTQEVINDEIDKTEQVRDLEVPVSSAVLDHLLLQQVLMRICRECVILTKLFRTWSDRIIIHHIIHSRIEYLCHLVQYVYKNHEEDMVNFVFEDIEEVQRVLGITLSTDAALGSVYPMVTVVLFKVFLLLYGILAHEVEEVTAADDIVSHFIHRHDAESFRPQNSGKTSWYKVGFTTVAMILGDMMIKKPQLRNVLNQTKESQAMDVYGAWTTSTFWQIQYLALVFIHSSLVLDYFQQQISINNAGLNNNAAALKKANSMANLQSSTSKKVASTTDSSKQNKAMSRLPSKKSMGSSSAINVNANNTVASGVSSKNGLQSQTKDAEELCRIGYLRTITWFFLHSHFSVRKCASEILLLLVKIASIYSTNSILWSCCVEQGIVPLLEAIAIGKDVYNVEKHEGFETCSIFPEENIRMIAMYVLSQIAIHLERDSSHKDNSLPTMSSNSKNTRQRLLAALTHSGNSKLRMNILTGMLFLASRSTALGRMLWEGEDESTPPLPPTPMIQSSMSSSKTLPQANTNTTSGKQHILMMFSGIVNHDVAEIKQILHLMIYFLHLSMKLHEYQSSLQPITTNEDILQDIHRRVLQAKQHNSGSSLEDDNSTIYTNVNASVFQDDLLLQCMERINPIILVGNTSQPATHLPNQQLQANRMMTGGVASMIKMVCPLLPIIAKNCYALAKEIKEYHQLQIREAYSILMYRNFSDMQNIEREIKQVLSQNNILDEKLFLKLHGSYTLWQEIFSHMSDSYLLKQSVARLSLNDLIDALSMATYYHMPKLIDAYLLALQDRISVSTIVQIIPCITFERSKHNIAYLQKTSRANLNSILGVHLGLCIKCVEFLRTEWDQIRKKLPPQQFQTLLQQVSQIMSLYLL